MSRVRFAEPCVTADVETPAPIVGLSNLGDRWISRPGLSFSEALTDWLVQFDVRQLSKRQQKMLWYSIVGRDNATKGSWHYPAIPFSMETAENADRLLPTFKYDFLQRGSRWIFYNLQFSQTWKCDPENGNIIVPTLDAWSTIIDNANHYRQARDWPLLVSPCDCSPGVPRYDNYELDEDIEQENIQSSGRSSDGTRTSTDSRSVSFLTPSPPSTPVSSTQTARVTAPAQGQSSVVSWSLEQMSSMVKSVNQRRATRRLQARTAFTMRRSNSTLQPAGVHVSSHFDPDDWPLALRIEPSSQEGGPQVRD